VARHTARPLGRPPDRLDLITLQFGNGASACAVSGGPSIATSMGLSPLAGLVMGARSGDLDPAVLFHLHRVGGLSVTRRLRCATP
jgi:acetate kinase